MNVELKIDTNAIVEAVKEQVVKHFADRLWPAYASEGPDAPAWWWHDCGAVATGEPDTALRIACVQCGRAGRWSQLYVWED